LEFNSNNNNDPWRKKVVCFIFTKNIKVNINLCKKRYKNIINSLNDLLTMSILLSKKSKDHIIKRFGIDPILFKFRTIFEI
jgi:hypothetical protein